MIVSLSREQKEKLEDASQKELLSMGELMRDAIMDRVNRILKRFGEPKNEQIN
jgi:5-methylcytosine-specific restriction endonuclease McrBC GTP-binding regulatory subunit McrB